MDKKFSLMSNGVDINFLSIGYEFGEYNRIICVDLGSCRQIMFKCTFVPDNIHCSTRQHIAGANQHGIRHVPRELLSFLDVRDLDPGWLINTNRIEDLRKLVAVLC